jgi:hypothetical protein
MQKHRHQEFIRFLDQFEAQVPAGTAVRAILDNYAGHKHPKARKRRTPSELYFPLQAHIVFMGSMQSKASSPNSLGAASRAASFDPHAS